MQKSFLFIGFLFSSLFAFANVSGEKTDSLTNTNQAPDSTLIERKDTLLADSATVDTVMIGQGTDSLGLGARVDSLGNLIPADSLITDSLLRDSLLTDSLVADTLVADTLAADSVAADSLAADSVAIADSVQLVKKITWRHRTDSITNLYQNVLMCLVRQRNQDLRNPSHGEVLDAYSLRLAFPPTFYSSSVLQQFVASDELSCNDPNLLRMSLVNDALARMYVNKPELVIQTDDEIEKSGILRDDVHTSLTTETKLTDKVVEVDLGAEVNEGINLVTRKPNFWKFPGSGSLKFTQNYFSGNWYQGGENFYSFLCLLTLNANYDNKQNIQWENRLEVRLGFQTTGESEKHHAMKPTDNLLRLTTKLGYKAYKTLYYTTQIQAYTQLVPLYDNNSDNIRTDFLSPLNLTVSVGLDYKFATKNNKFRGNIYMAPCSYNMRYVYDIELANRHGIEKGHHAYHNFGPSVTINAYWQIAKNISWNSRMYWISNLKYTNIEMENTISFTINKYLSSKLFVYPKFDDSSSKYMSEGGSYFMLKEWFSLGLDYNW